MTEPESPEPIESTATNPSKRRKNSTLRKTASRVAAVKILYQLFLNPGANNLDELLEDESEINSEIVVSMSKDGTKEVFDKAKPDMVFTQELVEGATSHALKLDEHYQSHLSEGWNLDRISPLMKAILRLACYEAFIKKHLDTKIIITEYVNLARAFMDDSEAGFVNAVLDSCLKENLNRA